MPFLVPTAVSLVIGLILVFSYKNTATIRPTEGLLLVACAWFVGIIISMVPYMMFGMSFADALFESTSGLTTTGASIMMDISSWPQSLLLWRSFTQWIGGIAVIIMFMLILPMMGFGSRRLLNNELSGSGEGNYSTKLGHAAREFMFIYGGLSVALIVILLLLGVNLMDSACIMMSTISTGGFMCNNSSIMDYSFIVQIVIVIFMFMGATNFYLHYKAVNLRSLKVYLKNSEAVCMLIWYVAITAVICLVIDAFTPGSIKDVLFTVVSIGTSTGFATVDYTAWPSIALLLLVFVAFFGGSSGSTAGGVKIRRMMVLYKFITNEVRKITHPRALNDMKIDGDALDRENTLMSVGVFLMFLLSISAAGIAIMLNGSDASNAFVGGLAIVTNVGPGFGEFGPFGSFGGLTDATKIFLSFMMWLGRMEIMAGIVILTPSFWREYGIRSHIRKNDSRLRRIFRRA
jgi:trk system potassium uptake protein